MLLSALGKRTSVAVTLAGSATLALLAGCSSSGSADSPESSTASGRVEWSYSGATGPQNWASLSPEYATCGDGKVQSPIDIVNPKQTGNPNPVVAYTATQATVVNSGHDLDMVSPAGNKMTINGKTYEVEEAHLHTPAENLLNGKRFDAEIHAKQVDADHKYSVFTVFVTTGAANAAWQPFFDAADVAVGASGEKISINWAQLLPAAPKATIQFPGSLTTPPCTEGVSWIVDPQPITMSQSQLDTLRAVYNNNDRPVQPLHGRPITQDAK